MDRVISKEAEIRWSSPSVIAKLMGLDEQPSVRVVHKQRKATNDCFQETSAVGLQEKYLTRKDHSPWMSTAKNQELKDVYEVRGTLEVERDKKKPANKALPSLKQYKPDVSIVGQSSMDMKHVPTDESLRISKESNNELGDPNCRKHHFLKAFQEPNFLFRKYFHDLKWLRPSHLTSKFTIFKSSKGAKIESGEVCCLSERKTGRSTHLQNDIMSVFRKPITGIVRHSLEEQSGSLMHKLAAGNNNLCIHPNHIVVLKPSIDKAQSKGKSVLVRTPENTQFASRRLTTQTGFQESHIGGRDWPHFSHNVEVFGHKSKGSREISREITEQLRESISSSNNRMPVLGLNRFSRDENSCVSPGTKNLCNSEASSRSSNYFNEWNSIYGSSLSSSNELRRDLRNGKWKMTDHSKEAGAYSKGSSTLAEMLALSNLEARNTALGSPMVRNVSDEKSTIIDMRASRGSPSSISSRDNWEDGFFINLPKSTSLPAPSTTYGSRNLSSTHRFFYENFCAFNDAPKSRSKKCNRRGSSSLISIKSDDHKLHSSDFGGEENNLPSQEIHMYQEKMRKDSLVKTPAEVNSKLISVPHSMDADALIITNDELAQLSMANISENPKVSIPNSKDALRDRPRVDYKLLTPGRMKEPLQPCPISVVELPWREDDSGCSDNLIGDLLELHKKSLSLESIDPFAEALRVLTLCNEDDGEECQSIQQNSYLVEEFMDEEERDYTYLLDILIVSGVHSAKQDMLCNACHSPEYPVKPTLFEKLEKKYGKLVSWSQSERKLMFDLTNSILAEVLAPCTDLHPWVNPRRRIGPMWGSEGLVEKTWQMLVGKRIELNVHKVEDKVLDPKWLDLGDNIDEMGMEMERILKEELLEELVADFMVR